MFCDACLLSPIIVDLIFSRPSLINSRLQLFLLWWNIKYHKTPFNHEQFQNKVPFCGTPSGAANVQLEIQWLKTSVELDGKKNKFQDVTTNDGIKSFKDI